jgi:hypothetical protein
MRSSFRMAAAALGVATVWAAIPAGAASADNGDNRPGCSSGEICFWYDSGTRFEKQFWFNGDHGGNNFMDTAGGGYAVSNLPVHDNARDVTNRDSSCRIRVGNLWDGVWTWEYYPNDGVRYFLRSVNNRNDRHERCV